MLNLVLGEGVRVEYALKHDRSSHGEIEPCLLPIDCHRIDCERVNIALNRDIHRAASIKELTQQLSRRSAQLSPMIVTYTPPNQPMPGLLT
jgi:hypothetical protein